MLKVLNKNDFDLKDRFDGRDYLFPAGKTVICPEDVARHVFGIGDPDKTPYLVRQGWMRSSGESALAQQKLDNFVFTGVDAPPEDSALMEQRSAPLLLEPEPEVVSDSTAKGSESSPEPKIPPRKGGKRRSVLDNLSPQAA